MTCATTPTSRSNHNGGRHRTARLGGVLCGLAMLAAACAGTSVTPALETSSVVDPNPPVTAAPAVESTEVIDASSGRVDRSPTIDEVAMTSAPASVDAPDSVSPAVEETEPAPAAAIDHSATPSSGDPQGSSVDERWCVAIDDYFGHLNLRSGPSLNADIVAALPYGHCGLFADHPPQPSDEWLFVRRLDGGTNHAGWVHLDYAEPNAARVTGESMMWAALDSLNDSSTIENIDPSVAVELRQLGAAHFVPDPESGDLEPICTIGDGVVCAVTALDANAAKIADLEVWWTASGIDHELSPGAERTPVRIIGVTRLS